MSGQVVFFWSGSDPQRVNRKSAYWNDPSSESDPPGKCWPNSLGLPWMGVSVGRRVIAESAVVRPDFLLEGSDGVPASQRRGNVAGYPGRGLANPWSATESATGRGYLLGPQLIAASEQVVDVPATLAARVRVLGYSVQLVQAVH